MESTTFREIRGAIDYWWLLLIIGIIFIGVGVWVFASPAAAYLSLTVLFGASILATGIFETVFAISSRKFLDGWGWSLAGGLLDIIIGVFLLIYPVVTMAILPFILGFWLLFRGFSAFGFSLDIKSYGDRSWGWLLISSILIIILAIAILAVPAFGVANIIVWTGLSFIVAGIYQITLAFKFRKWKKGFVHNY